MAEDLQQDPDAPRSPKTGSRASVWILFVALAIVIVLIAYLLKPWRGSPSHPFNVVIATWPGFGPGYIGVEKQKFGSLPVNFAIIDDFSARQAAYRSGKFDATIGTLDSFAFDLSKGVPGHAVLVLDESYGADAIVARPGINTADDLKGKKVAFTRGSPSHFFLIEYLRAHGLATSDIEQIPVDDPGRAGDAFIAGSVDAAVTWEPNITQIVNSSKGHVLESTRSMPGRIVDVLIVSDDAYRTRRADIASFVAGWLASITYINDQQHDAYRIMASNLHIPLNQFPTMAAGLRYANLDLNHALLEPPASSPAVDLFDRAGRVWMSEGLAKAPPPPGKDVITPEFLPH